MSLMPDQKEIIEELPIKTARHDGKFNHMPETQNVGMQNLVSYDEFYYRDYRTQRVLVDARTGESLEWTHNNDEGLNDFLSLYPQVTVIEQQIPTVRVAIVVQGKVLYDGLNPLNVDRYPFVPVFGYYNPQIADYANRIQGVVRGLRDAQFLYNRRRIIELDILESQINSGFIYKEDALVNPKDVFMSGQGRGLALKAEANMTDVLPIQPPQIPPSMIQLSELLAQEVQQISGVNEELLGSAVDDKAGILSMLRQGAGLTTLQVLFDQLDRSQKLLGRLMLEIINKNFTPGKVKRVIEEEPAPQFYNKAFGKYDAAIEDGLNTTTQRQMQFAQMLQLREAGVPISTVDLLEAATIQNKKKIIENAVRQEQQQMQQEQAQAESAMKEQQARVEMAQARAVADRGLGVERMSRIAENQELAVERRAEASKDRKMALLNFVKALKELEDMDISQVERLINLSVLAKDRLEEQDQATAQNERSLAQKVSEVGKIARTQMSEQPEGLPPQ